MPTHMCTMFLDSLSLLSTRHLGRLLFVIVFLFIVVVVIVVVVFIVIFGLALAGARFTALEPVSTYPAFSPAPPSSSSS